MLLQRAFRLSKATLKTLELTLATSEKIQKIIDSKSKIVKIFKPNDLCTVRFKGKRNSDNGAAFAVNMIALQKILKDYDVSFILIVNEWGIF